MVGKKGKEFASQVGWLRGKHWKVSTSCAAPSALRLPRFFTLGRKAVSILRASVSQFQKCFTSPLNIQICSINLQDSSSWLLTIFLGFALFSSESMLATASKYWMPSSSIPAYGTESLSHSFTYSRLAFQCDRRGNARATGQITSNFLIQRKRTGQTGQTGQIKLTLKLYFLGNFCNYCDVFLKLTTTEADLPPLPPSPWVK